eukprot:TRINITY_DN7132_c0_g3_i1.p1 TRINITY_DN7132_c0_g3~~TRINITY_DN7132_c0_g3_i1.p1  ORF type:complete len:650 (+),score=131.60 TRINITY_DN7132_c0_g3_i1:69-1952(+)
MSAVNLEWRDLSYSIADKKAPDGRKWILQPQNGRASAGELVALMGPSGSGKTSVLNALAGRLPITRGARFAGSLTVSGVPKAELPCAFADISAYVEQEDVLYALSTVQETLDFAARLRLPSTSSPKERAARIEDALRQLGLVHVRNTNVGGSSFNGALRGLSGGERKRLSIAVELLHQPRVLFLDEPTTGLDSYQALNVMEKLRDLAREGHTVVISIHQPRSSIFALFSSIYLLAAGKPVYAGQADVATKYFEDLGHTLPPNFNPADFFIDLVSIDQRDSEAEVQTSKRLAALHDAWASKACLQDDTVASSKEAGMLSIMAAKSQRPAGQVSFVAPLLLLLRRGWREQMRDRAAITLKICFQAFFTLIFSFVYYRLGYSQSNIQDRMGLLFFVTMNMAFGSVIGCAQTIPRQLVVVNRERANRLYSVFPFYVSSLMVMLPIEALPQLINNAIMFFLTNLSGNFGVFFLVVVLENIVGISLGMCLSASFRNVTMAAQIAPAVVILFLMFSGFLINEGSIPAAFLWLREISFIRYAFKAVAVNEMEGTVFECNAGVDAVCISRGEQVLAQLGFDQDNLILLCISILVGMFLVFNSLAFGILLYFRPKFLGLESPASAEGAKKVSGVVVI